MSDIEPTTKETYASLVGNSTSKATFTTENFNWRIWEIDEDNDKLTIIADGVTSKSVVLQGFQGYNNGVGILNEMCKKGYSKLSKNAIGRSFSFLDLEGKLTSDIRNSDLSYTPDDVAMYYNYYPLVFAYEAYSVTDGKINLPGGEYAVGKRVWNNHEQKSYFSSNTTRQCSNWYCSEL